MRCSLWSIFLFFCAVSFAAVANTENSNNVTFSIKPLVCIVKKPGDVCSMTVTVSWQSTKNINSCLYQSKIKVVCWLNKKNIKSVMEINIEENMEYTLRDDNHQIIAQQLISINSSLAKKYRRRLRAGWSLF